MYSELKKIMWMTAENQLKSLKKMEKEQHRPGHIPFLVIYGIIWLACGLAYLATQYTLENGGPIQLP